MANGKRNTIATAYVQIVPSMEGVKGKLEEEFEVEGKQAGSKFSGAVSTALGGLTTVANGVATGVAATATATIGSVAAISAMTANLGKEAIAAYSDFEQLEGGIETLFGSDAHKVMTNANMAFRSAGQSANQYMEMTIQSAASMISSLEGDTSKAAELMDLAIVDMSDNVNKMGTSMEAVQNAYRGFSRGNFTMLDNLALGFAGTKEGMQQLLDQAKEISGIEYNIESYSDIVQAIHVVQEQMGIAGTTQKEAAETITGSISAAKSAWDNLIAGLANADGVNLGQLINNFAESAETVINNLLPVIERTFDGIANFIEQSLPVLLDKIPAFVDKALPSLLTAGENLVTTMADGISTALPKMTALLAKSISQIGDSIESVLPQITPIISEVMVAIAQLIADNTEQFASIAVTVFGAIGDGMIAAAPILLSALPTLIETIASGMASNPGAFLALGSVIVSSLLPVVTSALSSVFGLIGPMLQPMLTTTIQPAISTALSTLGTTLSTALASVGTAITGALSSLWAGLVTATNEFFIALTADMGTAFASGGTAALGTAAAAIVGSIVSFFVGAETGKRIGETLFPNDAELYAQYEGITGTFDLLKDYFIALKDFYIMLWEEISAGVTSYFAEVKALYATAWTDITTWFANALTRVGEFFTAVGNFFATAWENIMTRFTEGIAKAEDLFTGFIEKSLGWGTDLLSNFISGIKSKFGDLRATLTKLGELVKALIGFSEPEEGPLSNFHTYAPDMMKLFAQGIKDNEDIVTAQIESSFDFGAQIKAQNANVVDTAMNSPTYAPTASVMPVEVQSNDTLSGQFAQAVELLGQLVDKDPVEIGADATGIFNLVRRENSIYKRANGMGAL